ncbi:MAG: hypothetical protein OXF32_00560 [Anaerolineaceae bacterium]|nr:hypothetical protein [Anaerolineaceae bacterium]
MPADLIAEMLRQLPPSASTLQLLDLGGHCAGPFSEKRQDLNIHRLATLPAGGSRYDAIVALDQALAPDFLESALRNLRPGGRLIIGWRRGEIDAGQQLELEAAGFERILLETQGDSLLLRGERPREAKDCAVRGSGIGVRAAYGVPVRRPGRYLHLLLRQTPERPPWDRAPGDDLRWQALTLDLQGERRLLAFSSLPQAVAFMQPAVLQGRLPDVNKVGKFPREAAGDWPFALLLDPAPAVLERGDTGLVEVDPASAALPDE